MQKFYLRYCTDVICVGYVQFKRNFGLCGLYVCDFNRRNGFCIRYKRNFNRFVLICDVLIRRSQRIFVVGFQAVNTRCACINVLHFCAVLPKRNCTHLLIGKRFVPHKTPFDAFFADLHVFEQNDCVGIDCFFVESVEFCAVAAQVVIKCDNTVLIHCVWCEIVKDDVGLFADFDVLCQHIHTVVKHGFCISAALFDERIQVHNLRVKRDACHRLLLVCHVDVGLIACSYACFDGSIPVHTHVFDVRAVNVFDCVDCVFDNSSDISHIDFKHQILHVRAVLKHIVGILFTIERK